MPKHTAGSDKEACNKQQIVITYNELPLACPPRKDRVWDAHPRIYLPIEEVGDVVCPYCGTQYLLKDFSPKAPDVEHNMDKKITE